MTRPVAVLRPEPGNAATAARVAQLGLAVIRLPLFATRPLAWTPPDPALHDALILTSANTLRHGGAALATLRDLPVFAVGEATAQAARTAGFDVIAAEARDVAGLFALAKARGVTSALHLGGRDRIAVDGGPVSATIAVYASDAIPLAPAALGRLHGSVALLHSARAARQLAAIVADSAQIRIATLSEAILAAAGPGWGGQAVAIVPTDVALIAAARTLVD